jgi:hypothetical protein
MLAGLTSPEKIKYFYLKFAGAALAASNATF